MGDTLPDFRRLGTAGVDRDMAETHDDTIQTAVDDRQENQATKADIGLLKTNIAAMEARLTWRMVGLQIGFGGLIIAIL